MKAITWLASFAVTAVACATSAFAAPLDGWSEDLSKALEQAKKENKAVLVEFTGSDWCPPCMAMRKDVFSKKEFVSAAGKKFVLVEIDLPKGDAKTKEKNLPLVQKHRVEAFPTVILMDADGKEFTRFTATQFPTTDAFLKHLDEQLEKKDLD